MIRLILAIFALLWLQAAPVWASGFNISSIGGVATNGVQMSKFWHSSSAPTLKGEAEPGQEVTITIDGEAWTTAADSAGEWVFTPQSDLSAGDHEVTVSNGSSTISMTLTTGADNVDWDAVSKGGGETLPSAGGIVPTLVLLGGGGTMLATARGLLARTKKA